MAAAELHRAARAGDAAGCAALLEGAASAEARGELLSAREGDYEYTALHVAARLGGEECVTTLLAHAGDSEERSKLLFAGDKYGETALHRAAALGGEKCIIALLAQARDSEERTKMLFAPAGLDYTALHEAARYGREECIVALLKHSLDSAEQTRMLFVQNVYMETPLFVAAKCGQQACVQALLQYADDPNEQAKMISVTDNKGCTCMEKSGPEVRKILEAAANGEVPCGRGHHAMEAEGEGMPMEDKGDEDAGPSQRHSEDTPGAGAVSGTVVRFYGSCIRHNNGIRDVPRYLPIKDFVKLVKPTKTVRTHFLEDTGLAFPSLTKWLDWYAEEAANVATSIIENGLAGPLDPQQVFSVVLYTLDVREKGGNVKDNFYVQLNQALQKRDISVLTSVENYLHFLMSALVILPPLPEQIFFRGVNQDALTIVQENYTSGRKIHWSGLTSVSTDEGIAKEFALEKGHGGVLFRIKARSAKSIQNLSAVPQEAEALLLPNFAAFVGAGPTLVGDVHVVDLVEVAEAPTMVF